MHNCTLHMSPSRMVSVNPNSQERAVDAEQCSRGQVPSGTKRARFHKELSHVACGDKLVTTDLKRPSTNMMRTLGSYVRNR